jgi:hypothetical protein
VRRPFTPLTLVGTVSESYTNAAICGVPQGKLGVIKPVAKGTFSGSAGFYQAATTHPVGRHLPIGAGHPREARGRFSLINVGEVDQLGVVAPSDLSLFAVFFGRGVARNARIDRVSAYRC